VVKQHFQSGNVFFTSWFNLTLGKHVAMTDDEYAVNSILGANGMFLFTHDAKQRTELGQSGELSPLCGVLPFETQYKYQQSAKRPPFPPDCQMASK